MNRRALLAGLVAGVLPAPARAEDWIVAAITDAAARHGVDAGWLLHTARCESELRPDAYNPRTGDCGLFQFNPDTWEWWGGGDIWSVYEQSEKAAWAFAQGYHTHWCCSGTWQGGPCQ